MNKIISDPKYVLGERRPEVTICVPTYNRGKLALKNLKLMLTSDFSSSWQILILDNGSLWQQEEYFHIKEMSKKDSRIKYVRKNENTGFGANVLDCFLHASSNHLVFISDEDIAEPNGLRSICKLFRTNPELVAVRASVGSIDGTFRGNSFRFEDRILVSPEDRFKKYSIFNNYISGSAYNRNRILNHGLIERVRKGLKNHIDYPHIYLDILVSAVGPVANSSIVLALEGEGSHEGQSDYTNAYKLGRRIDQFIHLRDALHEGISLIGKPFDELLFVNMYIILCQKYTRQICQVNRSLYMANNIDTRFVALGLIPFFISAIKQYPFFKKYMKQIESSIYKSVHHFKGT